MKHFIDSLRDEVRIVKRVPKKFSSKSGYSTLEMPPVSWSNEKYYLEQVCFFYELRLRKQMNSIVLTICNLRFDNI